MSIDGETNLLSRPILGMASNASRISVTLPELLARYSAGEPLEATALRAHQQHAWHAFLVQLAALTLVRAGEGELGRRDEAWWREHLVAAAKVDGAGAEAFTLVVDDVRLPAFLQPPIPSGAIGELKNEHPAPSDELDVLVTSRNHDLKRGALARPELEHWVYALVTLQTMQGFLGAGNYGIARMNGGFASRPCVAYAPSMRAVDRFRRDVAALLSDREPLLDSVDPRGPKLGLVWSKPWDGSDSIPFGHLDPFFIEICRRVRLVRYSDGAIAARRGSSKAARIDGKALSGNTGDAWTPVAVKTGTSLTVPASGFAYDRVKDLLLGDDFRHGAAGELRESDAGGDLLWLGQVLVRGQGTTDGYHERWLPVPSALSPWLRSPERRVMLAERAQRWALVAGTVRLKVLKPALLTLLQGGPDKLNFKDERADAMCVRFDHLVDEAFFHELFEGAVADVDDEVADARWQTTLKVQAADLFEEAFGALPVPIARRYRARARAEDVFEACAFKHLPGARPPQRAARSAKAENEGSVG